MEFGVPIMLYDAEQRHDASTLNKTAAQSKINGVLGGLTVDQWIAANPTKTISSFGLGGDTIFTGLSFAIAPQSHRGGRILDLSGASSQYYGDVSKQGLDSQEYELYRFYAYGKQQRYMRGVGRGEFEPIVQQSGRMNKAYFRTECFRHPPNFRPVLFWITKAVPLQPDLDCPDESTLYHQRTPDWWTDQHKCDLFN